MNCIAQSKRKSIDEQKIGPASAIDLDGYNAYNITFWITSQTSVSSKVQTEPPEVYYRIYEDEPELLLKADSLFCHLKNQLDLPDFNRYDGDGFEIVVEPIVAEENQVRTANSNRISITISSEDTESHIQILEEFLSEANSVLHGESDTE